MNAPTTCPTAAHRDTLHPGGAYPPATSAPAVPDGLAAPGPAVSPAPDPAATRPAREVLLAAAIVGVLGDLLLREVELGLNLALWTGVAVGALLVLARRQQRAITVAATLLAGLALAFAACVVWRDAETLAALAIAGLLTALCALAAAVRHGAAWAFEHAEAGAYAAGAWAVAHDVAIGARHLGAPAVGGARAAEWAPGVRAARAALGGVALAAPVLLVFGALLVSADRAFGTLLERLLDVDVPAVAGHAFWSAAGAWAAAGYLAGTLFATARATAAGAPGRLGAWLPRVTVRTAEVCVALALVDLLLLSFVAVQAGWLLGNGPTVGAPGLGYAEYARRGFFELVAVVALALPLLVAATATAARDAASPAARRAHRWAAGLLVALLGALVVSAADRMRLYQAAYGLTELRLYVCAFLAWLAAVLAWAAPTLLRGGAAPFALGSALLGWGGALALHAVNPAELVVRVNAARVVAPAVRSVPAEARGFDAAYLGTLGADAVPAVVARAVPAVAAWPDARARCEAAGALLRRAASVADARGGWRGWNLARWRARRALRRGAPALDALAASCGHADWRAAARARPAAAARNRAAGEAVRRADG